MLKQEIEAQNRIAAKSYFTDTDEFRDAENRIEKGLEFENMLENIYFFVSSFCAIIAFLNSDWFILIWIICAFFICVEKRRWRKFADETRKSLKSACIISETQREIIKNFDNNYMSNFLDKDIRQKRH